MWRGKRSSWRCTDNGGCRGIISVHRGITKVHSGAARRRRRRIINPIHAAFVKGLGDVQNAVNSRPLTYRSSDNDLETITPNCFPKADPNCNVLLRFDEDPI